MTDHRIMNVRLNAHVLGRLVKNTGTAYQVIKGVPGDANLVGAVYVEEKHDFILGYEHDSFDPVPEGEKIPEVETEFRALQPVAVESDADVVH